MKLLPFTLTLGSLCLLAAFQLPLYAATSTALLATVAAQSSQLPMQSEQQLFQAQPAQLIRAQPALLPDTLLLTWATTTPVDIYLAEQPDQKQLKLLARQISSNSYRVAAPAGKRPYLYIQPATGDGFWVAERVLPLEGGVNFRDLGGYLTADGRAVQWGKLFRSGSMTDLTGADFQYLSQLQIKTMCDLRAREELAEEPTAVKSFAAGAQYLTRDYLMSDLMSRQGSLRMDQLKTAADATQMFKGFYQSGPIVFKQQLKQMFAQLLAGQTPLSMNCSAGKDRTGIAAALVLTALDVPRATVVMDYALSEKVYDFAGRSMRKALKARRAQKPVAANPLSTLPAEVLDVLMSTKPVFIEAMFSKLEQDYGSVQQYFKQELGLDDAQLQQLRQMYLTTPKMAPKMAPVAAL